MRKNDKKHKLPIRVYLLYLIVASFLFTGIAFSKYVTSGSAYDDARVARFGDIIITETGDIISSSTDGNTTENTFVIVPGVDIAKDVRLRFEGAEVACYVFVRVTPNGFFAQDDHYSFSGGGPTHDALNWAVDDGWTYLTDSDGSYVYYTVVLAGDVIVSKPVIKGGAISVSEDLKNSDIAALPALINIEVQGTAAQIDANGNFATDEMRALAAWNSVLSN